MLTAPPADGSNPTNEFHTLLCETTDGILRCIQDTKKLKNKTTLLISTDVKQKIIIIICRFFFKLEKLYEAKNICT